jgi:tripartite-type tricarboxylate transporter receptor subunit TctC
MRFLLLLLAALLAPLAHAADYTGPVRILVGFPAGGATDVTARLLSDKLKDSLGQSVIVENRGGAGGMIATQALKASPPNGSVIMLTIDGTHVIAPMIFKDANYDPAKDFTPLAGIAQYFNAMAVSGALNVQNLRDFGAWLKANPTKQSFGTPSVGGVTHFIGLIVGRSLGATNMTPVPYRGGAPLVQDLLAGQIPAGVGSLTEYIEHHRSGKVRILAISGTQRSKTAPEIPTFQELGIKGIEKNPWLAFFGPAGMPKEFVDRFNKAIAEALKQPDVAQRFAQLGNETLYAPPAQLQEWVTSLTAHWSPMLNQPGFMPK